MAEGRDKIIEKQKDEERSGEKKEGRNERKYEKWIRKNEGKE